MKFPRRVASRGLRYLAGYVSVGVLIALTQPAIGASAWYPPIAVGMALLVRHGLLYAPVVFAADLIVSAMQYGTGSVVPVIIAANTTLEVVTAAYLLGRVAFRESLTRETDILRLVVLAGGAATLVGATTGSALLQWASPDPAFDFLPQWRTWWIGDATGVIVFLPALLLLSSRSRRWVTCVVRALPVRRMTELAGLLATGGALCAWIFSAPPDAVSHRAGYEMLAFLPVVWAAVRFGPRTTAAVIVGIDVAAWTFHQAGLAGDGGAARQGGLESLQVFMVGLATGGLTLAIALEGQRNARALLAAHRDRLAATVRARTSELSAALAAAEKANLSKSEFVANISHELRTPMHAIRSFAGFGIAQADTADRDKLRGFFTKIDTSSRRLLGLVNDLLDLSKLEAGKMQLNLEHADLAAVGRQVCEELAGVAAARGVSIELAIRSDATCAQFDTLRIQQILTNILSNAIKFSEPDGRVTVIVDRGRIGDDTSGREALQLEVIDEGVGIPSSEFETIFDKFVQSSKTRTGAGGTGLGLAICRELAQAHGGTVHAEQNLPKGTRLVVRLPCAAVTASAPA